MKKITINMTILNQPQPCGAATTTFDCDSVNFSVSNDFVRINADGKFKELDAVENCIIGVRSNIGVGLLCSGTTSDTNGKSCSMTSFIEPLAFSLSGTQSTGLTFKHTNGILEGHTVTDILLA